MKLTTRINAAWSALLGRVYRRTGTDSAGPVTLNYVNEAAAASALGASAQGQNRSIADIYDLMPATDLHIRGVRRQLLFRFMSIPFSVVAGDDKPASDEAAKACRDVVEGGHRFKRVLAAIVEADLRGVSLVEQVYPTDDVESGPRLPVDFVPVLHQSIVLDPKTGAISVVLNETNANGTPISTWAKGKWIAITSGQETANFALRGAFRAVLGEWLGRMKAQGWELTALERFGMPIAVGKAATDTDEATLRTAFSNFGAAGNLIISSGAEVALQSAGVSASGQIPHETYLAASAQRISVGILGAEQSVTVGKDQGSQASAKSQVATTQDVLWGLWETATEVIERDVFAPITEYNFPGAACPKLVPNFDETLDLLQAAQGLTELGRLFDVPVSWGRELTGAPEPEGGEEILRIVEVAPPPGSSSAPGLPGDALSPAPDVQAQALNGAQMAGLQAIVQAVADGLMPEESALALVRVSIPTMSQEEAWALISPAAKFKPTPAAPAAMRAARETAAPEGVGAELTDPLFEEVMGVETDDDLRALATALNSREPGRAAKLEDALAGEILNRFLTGVTQAGEEPQE